MARIGVIGAGSWGTALAKVLCENGHEVTVWARRPELVAELSTQHHSPDYLPGIVLPSKLRFTANLEEATIEAAFLLLATPSHGLRAVTQQVRSLSPSAIVISAVKGIEADTLLRMSQVLATLLGESAPVVVLSGPSLAIEVAHHIPTAIVAAGKDLAATKAVQEIFMNPYFRVYTHHDVIGVELGGALKNIIALAAGIVDGAGFGDNTKAALMTRGLVEITRLGVKLGADPMTFAGLSGMGDLFVTCMSRKSRNRHVGEQIGRGRKLQDILSEMMMVAEGVRTTQAAYRLAQQHGVEMPITGEVYRVLFENKDAKQAVNALMTREAKQEKFG
ncbi:MAG: NAD(P)H-dependent glycerol-3-phosphate dehydrogenase [candidate division KSB1 bacterium]|nr:NAD(P)H-dependent glycerol-3-phosphate dehydrogenase [candidate division KSB1 bacterium]MDZ7368046.1 NAD(P)H-dependent glycerol-3-phosphate dehydrogenase [candidate division KSB1 bacterium]MDZ7405728.1 NAD(P)H-dependent glycerol-3-phosphate dehydrogenase [candidate division KSB1 bacterium]